MLDKAYAVIGVPCSENARWSGFYECLMRLDVPWANDYRIIQRRGPSVARNRNEIVREGLRLGAEWFFFLDDDLIFHPNVLNQLRLHNADAVCGVTLGRTPPFLPIVFEGWEGKYAVRRPLRDGDQGLQKITACSSGGFLVKRRVFEAMSDPWWTLGQLDQELWCDDLHFCKKLGEAGFDLYADYETVFGHIMSATVWPTRNEKGEWSAVQVRSFPFEQHKISA